MFLTFPDNRLNQKMTKTRLALATATAAVSPAFAATQLGDHITISGFGTVGYVQTDSNDGEYRREQQGKGASRTGTLLVDSNLGLQMTAKANDWLSGTVQALTEMRHTDDHLSTRIEWAFLKVTPSEGLSVRAGRLGLPIFLISDSRKIGYTNTWLRPADEVYGLDLLTGGLTGMDVTYRLPLASNALTVTALGGRSTYTESGPSSSVQRDVNGTKGMNIAWDGGWYTVRLAHIQGKPSFPLEIAAALEAIFHLDSSKVTYRFTGLGATVERNDFVLQTEYVQRRSSQLNFALASDAWYVLAGYRFNSLLPYVELAERRAVSGSSVAPQRTTALGLRWDAFSAGAVKFQLDHVDTRGTTGASFKPKTELNSSGPMTLPLTKPVTTFSVAVDFLF